MEGPTVEAIKEAIDVCKPGKFFCAVGGQIAWEASDRFVEWLSDPSGDRFDQVSHYQWMLWDHVHRCGKANR